MRKLFNKLSIQSMIAVFCIAAIGFSCNEGEFLSYPEGDPQGVADPYLQIVSPVISFAAGTASYTLELNVVQGTNRIDEVNIYSVYTDADSGLPSDQEVLLETIVVETDTRQVVALEVTYDDLKLGLTVDGSALPASDYDLAVGSGWDLRFEAITESGDVLTLAGGISMAVLSPYAGIYEVVSMSYYRIFVLRNDVTDPIIGTEKYIGSVDEDTFSYNDWWGPFNWTGQSIEFDVDFDDNSIDIDETGPIFSGNYFSTCESFPDDLTSVPCDASTNYLVIDLDTGLHEIYMTYGYVSGSGPREFYEELHKVVD